MSPDRLRRREPAAKVHYALGVALAVLIGAGLTLPLWWPL